MADKLEERLRSKRPVWAYEADGSAAFDFINPDGPEAADEITRLNAENAELRKALHEAARINPAKSETFSYQAAGYADGWCAALAAKNNAIRALITKASRDSGHGQ